jgi:hypothetical protein
MARDRAAHDVVLLDAYADDEIPSTLGQAAFSQSVASRLVLNGVVVLNLAQPETSATVVRAFRTVFTPFDCRQTPNDGNVVIFGARGERPIDRGTMSAWLARWDRSGHTDFSLRALADDIAGRTRPDCDRLLGGQVTPH